MKRFAIFILSLFVLSTSIVLGEEVYTPPPKLPAYKTPSEKMKPAIRFYDFRTSHIDLYRITKAPSVPVRAVAEFEPVSILLLTYFPGYYDNVYKNMVVPVINNQTKVFFFYDTTQMKSAILSNLSRWGISQNQINTYVSFVNTEVDSVWMRDSGPNPVVTQDNRYGIIDFRYYSDRYYDDKIPTELANLLNLNVFRPNMDYEGGNFMTNGAGLCMATKGSIYENLPMTDYDVRRIFKDYLGCEKTVFLQPLAGEGTSHIDMFAKFTSEDTILLGRYDYNTDCINYDILEQNYNILLNTTTVDGKPLKIVRIPMPPNSDGVWRTYTNSLLINKLALVPVYSKHNTYEAEALNAYKEALGPDWEIIPIDSEEIIPDGGAIHCITMTVPNYNLVKFQNDPEPLCGNSVDCGPGGCGSISTKGMCDGDVVLWCENNVPYYYDCASLCNAVPNGYPCEQKCEYNSQKGYYDCISDYQCAQCIDECQMGEKGCVDVSTSWVCAGDIDNDGCNERSTQKCNPGMICINGICSGCTPDCENKQCGDDGCGGSCGSCKEGEYCGSDYVCHIVGQDAGIDISDISDTTPKDAEPVDVADDAISDTAVDATNDVVTNKDAEIINDTQLYDIVSNDTIQPDSTIREDAHTQDILTQDTMRNDATAGDANIRIDINEGENTTNNGADNASGCSCSLIY